MADKEKLDELIVRIRKLLDLTDEIYGKEIYPVSFFSQAYDITYKMQDSLREMEIAQIALFEKQIRAHQAQIFSTSPLGKEYDTDENCAHLPDTQAANVAPPPKVIPEPQTLPEAPPPTAADRPHNDTANVHRQKTAVDIKKRLTLNDRFRFKRELFDGDEALMNRTIADLSMADSYDEGLTYLKSCFNWNFEDGVALEFLTITEKCFTDKPQWQS
ncbi:MAG: hypothetical protein LBP64_04100 [Tannerella sp.]|jgi:hypothetical protein|nr:hypothetical protein [Tannerella sp.]